MIKNSKLRIAIVNGNRNVIHVHTQHDVYKLFYIIDDYQTIMLTFLEVLGDNDGRNSEL